MRLYLSILLLLLTRFAFGVNYYVETTGDDVNSGLSEVLAKATIQDVLTDYDPGVGDTIFVGAGTFNEDNIRPDDGDEGFVIKGEGAGTTIINGDGTDQIFDFAGCTAGACDDVVFMDMTIQNGGGGDGSAVHGDTGKGYDFYNVTVDNCDGTNQAIHLGDWSYNASHASVLSNVTVQNCANGAVYIQWNDLTITNCTFSNNGGANGTVYFATNVAGQDVSITGTSFITNSVTNGALYCYQNGGGVSADNITITSCTFYNNSASSQGGAIWIGDLDEATLSVTKCSFYTNTASLGSAIYSNGCGTETYENNLFYENTASGSPGGVFYGYGVVGTFNNCTFADNDHSGSNYGGIVANFCTYNINNCILYGNETRDLYDEDNLTTSGNVRYCVYQNITDADFTIDGNSTTSAPGFVDASGDDYSITNAGAAYNAGSDSYAPDDDILGVSRPAAGTDDIGAYEYSCLAAIWEGDVSSVWETAGNWDINEIPCGDVTIPDVTGPNVDPILGDYSATINNLTINVGGHLTITSAVNQFTIQESLTMNGTIDHTGSVRINLTGSGETLSGTGTQTNAQYIITNGEYTLNGSWSIQDLQTITSASLSVATGNTLTVGSGGFYHRQGCTFSLAGTAGFNCTGATCWIEEGATWNIASGAVDIDGVLSTPTNGTGGSITMTGGGSFNVDGNATFNLNATMGPSSTWTFNGNTTIETGATFTAGTSSNLNINGNWTNNGNYVHSTETVTFGGGSQQTVTTGTSITYNPASAEVSKINESFADGNLPTDWTRSSTTLVEFVSTGCTVGGSADYYARLEGSAGTTLTSPSVDMSSGGDVTVSFEWRNGCLNAVESGEDAQVDYWNGSSWVTLTGWPKSGPQANQSFSETISGLTNADFQLRFQVNAGNGANYDDWDFDEISVTQSVTNDPDFTLSNEFYNVTLNGAGGVDMIDEFGVAGTLTLTNGVITCGAGDTVFVENTAGSSLVGHSNASFVNGVIRRNIASNTDTYAFPVGTGTSTSDYYLAEVINNSMTGPFFLTGSVTAGASPGYDSTQFDDHNLTVPTGGGVTGFVMDSIAGDAYWVIDGNVAVASGDYEIRLYTANFNKDWWTNNELAPIRRATASSTTTDWTVSGTLPADDATGRMTSDAYISATAVSGFSQHAIGFKMGPGPLPVSLLSLDAECSGYAVDVNWTTASEINNDYFLLEKADQSGIYQYLSQLLGSGTTTEFTDYEYVDYDYTGGVNYYRLTQFDFDGKKEVFDAVPVNCSAEKSLTIHVVPQEMTNTMRVSADIPAYEFFDVRILDAAGKEIYFGQHVSHEGVTDMRIPINSSSSGIYLVSLMYDDQVITEKVVWRK